MEKYLDKQGLVSYTHKMKEYIKTNVSVNVISGTTQGLPDEIVDFAEIVPTAANNGDVIIGYTDIQ